MDPPNFDSRIFTSDFWRDLREKKNFPRSGLVIRTVGGCKLKKTTFFVPEFLRHVCTMPIFDRMPGFEPELL